MSDEIRDLEDQVIYLSGVVREVLAWMDAAELSGTVPKGLRDRIRGEDQLKGIVIHIHSLREALTLLDETGDMGTVRKRLQESLAQMESATERLERRLADEKAKESDAPD